MIVAPHICPALECAPLWPKQDVFEVQLHVIDYVWHICASDSLEMIGVINQKYLESSEPVVIQHF